MFEKGRAIGADDFVVIAHFQKDMGVVVRRARAGALETVSADLDCRKAHVVVEVGNGLVCHLCPRVSLWWMCVSDIAQLHARANALQTVSPGVDRMMKFRSDGVEIAYDITGEGDPVLLIHGFASSARVNWHDTGWVRKLAGDGRMVITIDNRGHGASEKLYDSAVYGSPIMAQDANRLLEHLAIPKADVMGYSMGARITAFMAISHPERVRSAVLAGLAENMILGVGGQNEIAEALLAPGLADVTDPMPRAFRLFAESSGSDLRALAACVLSSRQKITTDELAEIDLPVLVAAGGTDDVAGPVEPLVAAIPGARGLVIPGRDHMRAVGDKVYMAGVLEFLAGRP